MNVNQKIRNGSNNLAHTLARNTEHPAEVLFDLYEQLNDEYQWYLNWELEPQLYPHP